MSSGRLTDLGSWASDDFEKTVRTASAAGVDSDLPDEVRFITGVAKLIRRRIAEVEDKTDPPRPAVFLLDPIARKHSPDIAPKRVPMLDNGLTAVNGRLWFVSPVPRTGSYIELEDCDDDELFHFVTDQLQLGDVPAVIFEPRTKVCEVRFYENGLEDPEVCEVLSIGNADISPERIFERINRIHEKLLITPDAQAQAGKLWQDSGRHWPVEKAESVIQLYLLAGLTMAFLTCEIRKEQPNVSGRLDIEIVESDPIDHGRFVLHAILELKVLRSCGSTGISVSEEYTLDWVESGVRQAASYRDERKALAAALCCFDMRCENTGEACFDHVVDLAEDNEVALKLWFIYSTSKQYRHAKIGLTEC